ncbi:hypothetical protein CALCODRAFT_507174 [Calocera cornea HHB12733]|uniref:Uncharacterized protein n=1 Tax=Calocera cornea HHB12733 TaxID=1353952 RepID=A0A165I1M0_9BASI|nr:hypothetical protein CALCODRAFT_507174 [Calocera cornea HHB12733]
MTSPQLRRKRFVEEAYDFAKHTAQSEVLPPKSLLASPQSDTAAIVASPNQPAPTESKAERDKEGTILIWDNCLPAGNCQERLQRMATASASVPSEAGSSADGGPTKVDTSKLPLKRLPQEKPAANACVGKSSTSSTASGTEQTSTIQQSRAEEISSMEDTLEKSSHPSRSEQAFARSSRVPISEPSGETKAVVSTSSDLLGRPKEQTAEGENVDNVAASSKGDTSKRLLKRLPQKSRAAGPDASVGTSPTDSVASRTEQTSTTQQTRTEVIPSMEKMLKKSSTPSPSEQAFARLSPVKPVTETTETSASTPVPGIPP